MRKRINILISGLVTIAILLFLFLKADIPTFIKTILKVNFYYLFAGFLGYLGLNITLAIRLKLFLGRLGYSLALKQLLLYHFSSMILGDVTPGKVGYFGMVLLLKDKVEAPDTLSILTLGQIMDFILKIMGTLAFLILISKLQGQDIVLIAILVLSGLTLIAILLLWSKKSLRLLGAVKGFGIGRMVNLLESVQNSSTTVRPVLIKAFLLSVFGWLFIGTQWYFLARSVGIVGTEFNFIYFLLLQSIASTVAFLPLSLGGIGLQESAMVGILWLSGIDGTIALAFSLLVRGMSMLVDAIPGMVYLRKLGEYRG